MSSWEKNGVSDEWYTPAYIFDALGVVFDLDVAAPVGGPRYVPAKRWLHQDSLSLPWDGFVWMNPPFGGRNGLVPWISKFIDHGNGIALTPDRTSAPWFQSFGQNADAILLVSPKVKFEKPDGTLGKHPGTGTALWGSGAAAVSALRDGSSLGLFVDLRASR